jgi:hypothetical protein
LQHRWQLATASGNYLLVSLAMRLLQMPIGW